jgi:hypothetical protein
LPGGKYSPCGMDHLTVTVFREHID